jgi:hypothetical protein
MLAEGFILSYLLIFSIFNTNLWGKTVEKLINIIGIGFYFKGKTILPVF